MRAHVAERSTVCCAAIVAALLIVAPLPCVAKRDESPSAAPSFVFKILERKKLLLTEEGSGRIIAGPDSPPITHELTQDYMRYLALDYATYCKKIGRITADSAFIIKSDKIAPDGDYIAIVIRTPQSSVAPTSQEEQARFEVWTRHFQPTPCVQDASLPSDTVRLEPGAERNIRPGYFFPKRPAKPPDYVPSGYVPTKVLRNDGKFLGWQYFAPVQLDYLHDRLNIGVSSQPSDSKSADSTKTASSQDTAATGSAESSAAAADSAPDSTTLDLQAGAVWLTEYGPAKARARAERKIMFIFLCRSKPSDYETDKLGSVLEAPEFRQYAAKELILLKLDFAQENTGIDPQQRNTILNTFDVPSLPAIVLWDPSGRKIANIRYVGGGAPALISAVGPIINARSRPDQPVQLTIRPPEPPVRLPGETEEEAAIRYGFDQRSLMRLRASGLKGDELIKMMHDLAALKDEVNGR